LLAFGALAQMLGFVVLHDSAIDLLLVSITVGLALLVLHELLITRTMPFMFAWIRAMLRIAARGSR
jgi:hypothetical protein